MNHLFSTIIRSVPATPPLLRLRLSLFRTQKPIIMKLSKQFSTQLNNLPPNHTTTDNNIYNNNQNNKRKVIVALDVSEFQQENVKVQVMHETISIECHHGIKKDYHGQPTRTLKRTFSKPKHISSDSIEWNLTNDGVLICHHNNDSHTGEKEV